MKMIKAISVMIDNTIVLSLETRACKQSLDRTV